MHPKQTIPVLDLKDFLNGTRRERDKFVQALGDSLREIGFFALENHGINSGVIDQAYGVAKAFFDLDVAEKKECELMELASRRGFVSFGREKAKDASVPDLKEFYHIGRDLPQNHELYSEYPRNIWPKKLPEFKEIMMKLYEQLDLCSMYLVQACARYLGEDENLFLNMIRDGETILRVINYPPIPADANPASIRAAAHEDINFLTILCESTDEGLELKKRDGTWLPIHALQGQVIVDSGDMMQNLTNGYFRSTTHRVVNPDNARSQRLSMPFFVHPRPEVSLKPLASCVAKTGGEVKFKDWTAKDYLWQRINENALTTGYK